MGIFNEFKEFISRGNIFDMSVGVIIGGAFSKIVTALTSSIIMPIITIFTGKVNYSMLVFNIGATEIPYGQFIQSVIDFLITAAVIFAMVKFINNANKKLEGLKKSDAEEEKPQEEAPPTKEEQLLCEIRDILKNK